MTRTLLSRPALASVLAALLLAGCGDTEPDADGSPAPRAQCSYVDAGPAPEDDVDKPDGDPPGDQPTELTISTDKGDIPVKLDAAGAPCAVNSFVSLAEQGYYDDTQCHRLTTEGYFVLQCGDPTGTGSGGPGYTFADELVADDPRLQPCGDDLGQQFCTYNPGIVAMANAGPDTNGSQFFLVYGASRFPPDYTVLGTMDAAGLKTVKEIAAAGIGTSNGMGPGDGAPKEPVTITAVK